MRFEEEEDIKKQAILFYNNLPSVNGEINQNDQEFLLNAIPKVVVREDNEKLAAIPSKEEIMKAVFSFEGNKDPVLDVFPMI